MSNPYRRHSTWLDVTGVVLLGALLLGPLAYLVPSMVGSVGGGGGRAVVRGSGDVPAAPSSPARPPPPTAPSSGPLLAVERPRSGGAVPAPFSDRWQAQAAPDLTGPSGGGGPVGGAAFPAGDGGGGGLAAAGPGEAPGEAAGEVGRFSGPAPSVGLSSPAGAWGSPSGSEGGPALAARQPGAAVSSGGGAGQVTSASRAGGDRSATRKEAERLAGQVRALSGQLRQMNRADAQGSATTQSVSDPGSPDDPDRRNPGSPSNVPIGDHLHWLAVAGILWGAWRIGRGA